ncbi:MAG: nucleotidyl transferase AbiEii/AbiGii toxin family protein [Aliidongia sp.]
MSKAYGLIERFSEDIDVTVFRDDLDEAVSLEDLEALSNKKRRARLDASETHAGPISRGRSMSS